MTLNGSDARDDDEQKVFQVIQNPPPYPFLADTYIFLSEVCDQMCCDPLF